MSGPRLRKQCVAIPDNTVLVTCYLQPNASQGHQDLGLRLVGHAFATAWDFDGGKFFLDCQWAPIAHIPIRESRLDHPACRLHQPVSTLHCDLSSPNAEKFPTLRRDYCDRFGLLSPSGV